MKSRLLYCAAFLFSACFAANGCAHLKALPVTEATGDPTGDPTGPATPTAMPSAGCQALLSTTTQIVDVSQGIAAITDPTYGPILGYALDPQDGTLPIVAAPITLRATDIVQFANIDPAIAYSAVGFGTHGFPGVPYTFPSGTQNPVGAQIGAMVWSTGRISSSGDFGETCLSQQFTLPQTSGTSVVIVYFGDYDHYNSTNGTFRDVIVVSNSAPQSRLRSEGRLFQREYSKRR